MAEPINYRTAGSALPNRRRWAFVGFLIGLGLFWIGAITISVRRSTLTQSDKLYLRFGLPAILLLGVPLFLVVWSKNGLI